MSELEGTDVYDFCSATAEKIALNLDIKFHFRCIAGALQTLTEDDANGLLDGEQCKALYDACMEDHTSDTDEFLQLCPGVQWSQCDYAMTSTQSCILEIFSGHTLETPDVTCETLAGTPHEDLWSMTQGGGYERPTYSDECLEIKAICLDDPETGVPDNDGGRGS
jgi:hypothetical protein